MGNCIFPLNIEEAVTRIYRDFCWGSIMENKYIQQRVFKRMAIIGMMAYHFWGNPRLMPPGTGLETDGCHPVKGNPCKLDIYCSENYFRPLYDYFHRELLKR